MWRFHLDGVCEEVLAKDADAAGGGGEQAGQHFDGGGFAGTIGAKKTEELAAGDGEVQPVDSRIALERAGEAAGLDGGNGHGPKVHTGNGSEERNRRED